MEVPERLAFIGGSILLASTLVFTLKSQASSIIPSVGHSISGIFDHVGDTQNSNDFESRFKGATQKGYWGTAPWYVKGDDIDVGSGTLNGTLATQLSNDTNNHIQNINFTEDVTFPINSYRLLAYFPNLVKINGGEHMSTSNVTSMEGLFLDDFSMKQVNMSHMDTSKVIDMNAMIYPTLINQLSLGTNTTIHSNSGIKLPNGTWRNQNNNSTLNTQQLADNHPHPGTWLLQ